MFRRALMLATALAMGTGLYAAPAEAVTRTDGVLVLELQAVTTPLDAVAQANEAFAWDGTGVLVTTGAQAVMDCEAYGNSFGSVVAEASTSSFILDCVGLVPGSVSATCSIGFIRTAASMLVQGDCLISDGTSSYQTIALGELAWVPTSLPPVTFYSLAGGLVVTSGV